MRSTGSTRSRDLAWPPVRSQSMCLFVARSVRLESTSLRLDQPPVMDIGRSQAKIKSQFHKGLAFSTVSALCCYHQKLVPHRWVLEPTSPGKSRKHVSKTRSSRPRSGHWSLTYSPGAKAPHKTQPIPKLDAATSTMPTMPTTPALLVRLFVGLIHWAGRVETGHDWPVAVQQSTELFSAPNKP